jgi:hypothetical protein
MAHDTGKLTNFLTDQPGYFRTDCDDFPWHSTDRSVWYALLVVENGEIVRYGFTSSKSSKKGLCDAIRSLNAKDEVLLLGIWNGQYSTHLFVIDPAVALEHLEGQKKYARFEHLHNATDVVKGYGPKGGFRHLSYHYIDGHGLSIHLSTGNRSEAEDLEAYFRSIGINIAEERGISGI